MKSSLCICLLGEYVCIGTEWAGRQVRTERAVEVRRGGRAVVGLHGAAQVGGLARQVRVRGDAVRAARAAVLAQRQPRRHAAVPVLPRAHIHTHTCIHTPRPGRLLADTTMRHGRWLPNKITHLSQSPHSTDSSSTPAFLFPSSHSRTMGVSTKNLPYLWRSDNSVSVPHWN